MKPIIRNIFSLPPPTPLLDEASYEDVHIACIALLRKEPEERVLGMLL